MASLWLLSCFTLIGASLGSGAPAGDPELSVMPRIINGMDAAPGAWPWFVSLQTPTGGVICGGSLINRFWVLTAAHCNITKHNLVITGLFDRSSSNDRIQTLRIAQIFSHPMYSMDTLFADVALLRLSTPARLHDTVSPALLPDTDEQVSAGTQCVTMGWGDTHPSGARPPLRLQQATVSLIPKAECKKHWGNYLSDSMICAGARDACNYFGDSGGPLVCPKDGFWKLVGIVCYVSIKYTARMPAVYTRVNIFRPWIEEVLAHN